MKVMFQVKTRKDGSIGIPKDKQRLMGIPGHTAVTCNWDSAAGAMTVVPTTVSCQCCGKVIQPHRGEYDSTLQTCLDCATEIEKGVRKGLSVRDAVATCKRQHSQVGRRTRK